MMRLALIGHGRWGANIERTLKGFPDVDVVVVEKGAQAPADVSGVLIATPSATHAAIALPYIERGIPTFIEKPLATSTGDAERLRDAARKSNALVHVGHVYTHNPAFRALQAKIPALGNIRLITSEKMNFGPRTDTSVFWDWLPHDLSMSIRLLGAAPSSVQAWGLSKSDELYGEGAARFTFPDQTTLISIVSWLSPGKCKTFCVVGDRATIVFDDMLAEKLLIRDANGSVPIRHDTDAPLLLELKSFVNAIDAGRGYEEDQLMLGITIVRCIEAAERSVLAGGAPIAIA